MNHKPAQPHPASLQRKLTVKNGHGILPTNSLPVETSWTLDAELGFLVSFALPGAGWTRASCSKSLAKVTPRAEFQPQSPPAGSNPVPPLLSYRIKYYLQPL